MPHSLQANSRLNWKEQMHKSSTLALIGLLFGVLLSACAASTQAPSAQTVATATTTVAETNPVSETAIVTEAAGVSEITAVTEAAGALETVNAPVASAEAYLESE